ncbi:MAG: tetratricopeptide repeat protein [Saprospiraceae bacterium]|nr:tetratricopeptide repeat protein [Saprospiraceae bacterium]
MKAVFIIFFSIITINLLVSQETTLHRDRLKEYKAGQEFFNNSLYESARDAMGKFIALSTSGSDASYTKLEDDARLIYAISGLRLEKEEAENEMLSMINLHYPDPVVNPAIMELGSYYYNKKLYRKAIESFERMDISQLSDEELSETLFKKGYCHFVLREFPNAKKDFSVIKDIKGPYYFDVNYYLGLSDYFMKNFNEATTSLQKAAGDNLYKTLVPYYLTQIYFAQGLYDEVIQTGEKSLESAQTENKNEIRLLIGQAYFNEKNYAKALPHLEFYEANTPSLTVEEFFQLAFTQYQMKKYNEAIQNFQEIYQLETHLGQQANYYLADCLLKTGDKVSARAAFRKVSQMNFEPTLQEEAYFNYGKLSAETGLERDALLTLLRIEEKSKYYDPALLIINDLLANSTDYDNSLSVIDEMPKINNNLKETYQKIALKNALVYYKDGNIEKSSENLTKALKYTPNRPIEAQTRFWQGQISHESGLITNSIDDLNKFFEASNGLIDLPDESLPLMGHYTQGYNYLSLKDYKNAEKSFKSSLTGFSISTPKSEELQKKILPDVRNRIGDCLFKQRNYKESIIFYDQAINAKNGNFTYAMYQKGIIEGLLGEPYEKIITLTELKKNYPNSEYADDALMQLGDTYLELNNQDNAYATFTELVTKFSGKSPLVNGAYLKMGLIAYNKGDLNTAIKNYKEVFKNNPSAKESQSALLGLEEIYINDLGKSEEYVQFLSTIPGYEVNAYSADSLSFKVGELRYQNGEYEKAVLGFNNYLTKYPKGFFYLKAHYLRAESNSILKNYTDALTDYEAVAKAGVGQNYEQAVRKSALISYNHAQNFEKALKYYELHYSTTNNTDEKYHSALGAMRSAFRLSNDESVIKYANLLISFPNAAKDDLGSAHYYLAKVSFRKKEYPQALLSFAKVSELTNNNQAAESRYMVAEIYFLQSLFEKAEIQCNEANKRNGSYPFWIAKSLILLSDIYVVKKDLFNARAALEAVLENFSDDESLVQTANEKLALIKIKETEQNRIKTTNTNQLNLQPRKNN